MRKDQDGHEIWVIIGQSNTACGDGFDPVLDAPDPRVDQFVGRGPLFGQVIPAAEPLLHPIDMGVRIGFGLTFGKLRAQTLPEHQRVLLVPCAKGGTGFRPWGGYTWDRHDLDAPFNFFRFTIMQTEAALAAGPNNRIGGFLWHQGEHDTTPEAHPLYADRLDDLIGGLRARFGADLPFILGQLNPDHMQRVAADQPGYAAVDRIHAETPARVARTAFVTGPAGSYNSEADTIHYNAAGQRELGRRYFAAARELLDPA
ncbi:sialate O-acetylesterase [Occultella gossypii]|uniref:Sialate O-acetylesterase domain-containing protein n=1 Tax=Occultella gossypii TaxID=2800820 RepID=A0ABS7SBS0_9MICO|nr:sialate O-acetylesterase [Occultella gossypii]MBZ2197185.1 hypothetical protein [Occultella gossypii]